MSEREPWTADRELDADGAARAIRHAVPELADAAVRPLGWGWDFDTFEAGGWVFRFPRREGEQARLRRDLLLLPWIGARLDAPLPRYAWGALEAPSFPYVFSGYPKLEGLLAAHLDPGSLDLAALGRRLGSLFRSLHALEPPADLVAATALDTPRLGSAALRDAMRKHLSKFQVGAPPDLAVRATRFFDDADCVPAAYPGPLRLVHDDLHCEHLLLDPARPERITGVLDWSDMALADPARDFSCLYSWGGDELLHAILADYGANDPGLEARARFLGTCLTFQDWAWWVHVGNDPCARLALRALDAALPA